MGKKLIPKEVESLPMTSAVGDRRGGWGPSARDPRSQSRPGPADLTFHPIPSPPCGTAVGGPGAQSPACLAAHAPEQLLLLQSGYSYLSRNPEQLFLFFTVDAYAYDLLRTYFWIL